MNELKPEDVMKALEAWIYDFQGTSTQFCALCDAITLLRAYQSENAEKDAEIERLKNSITFQVVMPDEKVEEIKAECLKRVELDINAIKAEAIKEFLKAIEDAISNLEYKAKTHKKTVTVETLVEQVNWVLHTIVPRRIKQVAADLLDDFPNCKISGCEAARKDCHIGCPHGKENKNENS